MPKDYTQYLEPQLYRPRTLPRASGLGVAPGGRFLMYQPMLDRQYLADKKAFGQYEQQRTQYAMDAFGDQYSKAAISKANKAVIDPIMSEGMENIYNTVKEKYGDDWGKATRYVTSELRKLNTTVEQAKQHYQQFDVPNTKIRKALNLTGDLFQEGEAPENIASIIKDENGNLISDPAALEQAYNSYYSTSAIRKEADDLSNLYYKTLKLQEIDDPNAPEGKHKTGRLSTEETISDFWQNASPEMLGKYELLNKIAESRGQSVEQVARGFGSTVPGEFGAKYERDVISRGDGDRKKDVSNFFIQDNFWTPLGSSEADKILTGKFGEDISYEDMSQQIKEMPEKTLKEKKDKQYLTDQLEFRNKEFEKTFNLRNKGSNITYKNIMENKPKPISVNDIQKVFPNISKEDAQKLSDDNENTMRLLSEGGVKQTFETVTRDIYSKFKSLLGGEFDNAKAGELSKLVESNQKLFKWYNDEEKGYAKLNNDWKDYMKEDIKLNKYSPESEYEKDVINYVDKLDDNTLIADKGDYTKDGKVKDEYKAMNTIGIEFIEPVDANSDYTVNKVKIDKKGNRITIPYKISIDKPDVAREIFLKSGNKNAYAQFLSKGFKMVEGKTYESENLLGGGTKGEIRHQPNAAGNYHVVVPGIGGKSFNTRYSAMKALLHANKILYYPDFEIGRGPNVEWTEQEIQKTYTPGQWNKIQSYIRDQDIQQQLRELKELNLNQ